jgi:hypothetical protein
LGASRVEGAFGVNVSAAAGRFTASDSFVTFFVSGDDNFMA